MIAEALVPIRFPTFSCRPRKVRAQAGIDRASYLGAGCERDAVCHVLPVLPHPTECKITNRPGSLAWTLRIGRHMYFHHRALFDLHLLKGPEHRSAWQIRQGFTPKMIRERSDAVKEGCSSPDLRALHCFIDEPRIRITYEPHGAGQNESTVCK